MKKITVLIPCLNEEKGIGKVIDAVPLEKLRSWGFLTEIIVVDNNSKDKTVEVAQSRGVKVVREEKQGKGYALKAGFRAVTKDTDYIVMLDGDDTYKASEIPRLIEPLESAFCDVIVGSRLGGKTNKGSFKFENRVANWIYTFLVRQIYRANVTDVLSGFFAWKKEVINVLAPWLESNGFSIEMEMITKMVRLGYSLYSVPITYDEREGESKLDSLKDGVKITRVFLKNLRWRPSKKRLDLPSQRSNLGFTR